MYVPNGDDATEVQTPAAVRRVHDRRAKEANQTEHLGTYYGHIDRPGTMTTDGVPDFSPSASVPHGFDRAFHSGTTRVVPYLGNDGQGSGDRGEYEDGSESGDDADGVEQINNTGLSLFGNKLVVMRARLAGHMFWQGLVAAVSLLYFTTAVYHPEVSYVLFPVWVVVILVGFHEFYWYDGGGANVVNDFELGASGSDGLEGPNHFFKNAWTWLVLAPLFIFVNFVVDPELKFGLMSHFVAPVILLVTLVVVDPEREYGLMSHFVASFVASVAWVYFL